MLSTSSALRVSRQMTRAMQSAKAVRTCTQHVHCNHADSAEHPRAMHTAVVAHASAQAQNWMSSCLACPICQGTFATPAKGVLRCNSCSIDFPVISEVPHAMPAMATRIFSPNPLAPDPSLPNWRK